MVEMIKSTAKLKRTVVALLICGAVFLFFFLTPIWVGLDCGVCSWVYVEVIH